MDGEQFAHYEITAKLGEGGMGEVYLARDTRLNRDVALKLLPPSFAEDTQRLARFQREAEVLASLNHPLIGQIYGLEESGGRKALVLELIEGDTLQERIEAGPIPVDQAIDIARQICTALEVAHDRGIVHRDLKPANIKLVPDGSVKVLDFGLAKAVESSPGDSGPSHSPTMTIQATQAGIIIGTAGYMSPEQARGKEVDKRADIWAFGCVLFEMVSGQRTFSGDDLSMTLASVMKDDPDWALLPSGAGTTLKWLLRRCLDKNPLTRLRDIGEARILLSQTQAEPQPETSGSQIETGSEFPVTVVAGILFAAILATAAVTWFVTGGSGPAPSVPMKLVTSLEDDSRLFTILSHSVELSQDGRHLAYLTGRLGRSQLNIRALDEWESRDLTGPSAAFNPTFSPDGNWILYTTGAQLMKIAITGGSPQTLADGSFPRGTAWGPEGTLVFASERFGGLSLLSESGGPESSLTTLGDGEVSHRWPQFLPGGRAVLFTVFSEDLAQARLEVVHLETGKRTVVHNGGTFGRFIEPGYLVFASGESLFATRFDPTSLETGGLPAMVVPEIMVNDEGAAQFTVAGNGTLVFLSGRAGGGLTRRQLAVWGRDNQRVRTMGELTGYSEMAVSPDKTKIAFSVYHEGDEDIWIYDIARNTLSPLTSTRHVEEWPVWSPDSKWVYFVSRTASVTKLLRRTADAASEAEELTLEDTGPRWFPTSVSPDGKWLLGNSMSTETHQDIMVVDLAGEQPSQTFLSSPANEGWAQFSPDGRWIAYASDESGRSEVFVRPFPGPGGRFQVSTQGGASPLWNADGSALLFQDLGGISEVRVTFSDGNVTVGDPQQLVSSRQFAWIGEGGLFGLLDSGDIVFAEIPQTDDSEGHQGSVRLVTGWVDSLAEIPALQN